jgi:hypothetical protein
VEDAVVVEVLPLPALITVLVVEDEEPELLLPGLVITTLPPEEGLPELPEELPELLPVPDVSSPGFTPTTTVSVNIGASFLLMDADGDRSSTVTELPEELPVLWLLPEVLLEVVLEFLLLPAVIVVLPEEDEDEDTPGPPLTVPEVIVEELLELELELPVPVVPEPYIITAFSRKVPLIISCRPSFVWREESYVWLKN